MTQGEVLSAFATIETFDQICNWRQKGKDDYMTVSDVNMMMPFVTKAQEAVEKLSLFALDNINSQDKKIKELVKVICYRFSMYRWTHNDFKGSDSSVDWLNNNIKSVNNQIKNTYGYLSTLEDDAENTDSRFEELEAENKRLSEKNKELEEENEQLKEENASTKKDESLKSELNRLKAIHEDTLVALLKPAFYNSDADARDFIRRINGLDNQGVTDVARQFLQDRKITPSKKGRFIWNILTAAKLYDCVEQNWTTALRK